MNQGFKRLAFLYPGSLDTISGGYRYDRRILAGLETLGWQVNRLSLSARFPFPEPPDRMVADAAFATMPGGSIAVIDGLAFGAMPEVAARHGGRLKLVALVHHPLALETGLGNDRAERLAASETETLRHAALIVVTGHGTARVLKQDYGVPASRLAVIEPGTDPKPRTAPPAAGRDGPTLLAVGAAIPRKGYDTLIQAMRGLTGHAWCLAIVGSLTRAPEHVRMLAAKVEEYGLGDRIAFLDEVTEEELESLYASADLFIAPTRQEGYGMAIAEALARSIPVLSTTEIGLAPRTMGQAVRLVPPDDPPALEAALLAYLDDSRARGAWRRAARSAAGRLPGWAEQCGLWNRHLEELRAS